MNDKIEKTVGIENIKSRSKLFALIIGMYTISFSFSVKLSLAKS